MLMIINLIEPRIGKLIINHLIGNTFSEFRNGLLDSYFFKLTLVAFKTILTQQYYKNRALPNQNLKHNSVHTPSLNLTSISFLFNLDFVCSSLTVTTQKANACKQMLCLGQFIL